jgi:hypothetical protein
MPTVAAITPLLYTSPNWSSQVRNCGRLACRDGQVGREGKGRWAGRASQMIAERSSAGATTNHDYHHPYTQTRPRHTDSHRDTQTYAPVHPA